VITADARLDNRTELAAKLGVSLNAAVREAGGVTDSQLILAAFGKWGDECVNHLLGDFAFAIWDPIARRLFCVRDAMGVRPFYYYHSKSLFVFASTACAVVAPGIVPRQVNNARIGDGLIRGLEGADATSSWFDNVYRLPPAHCAVLSASGLTANRYWQPNPDVELNLGSTGEYTDALKEQLTRAVERRLRCHKPVASMLSGGLDSSTIVGITRDLLRKQGDKTLTTFTGASQRGHDCRETSMSRLVIEQGGLDPVILRPSDVGRLNNRLLQVHEHLEDPFDSLWIMHRMIYLEAAARGHAVVLDGIDGDGLASLTTAYPGYLLRDGKWLTAHREIVGIKRNHGLEGITARGIYYSLFKQLLVPDFVRTLRRQMSKGHRGWHPVPGFVNSDFAESINARQRWDDMLRQVNPNAHLSLRHAHAARMTTPYLTAGIERYDRLAAICGVESRHPLLDRELVEFCISLPWNQKVHSGWSKIGMRRVAEGLLPHAVAWRRARDRIMWKFWVAWNAVNQDQFGQRVDKCLGKPRTGKYLDRSKLKKAWNSSIIEGSWERESALEALFQMEWLETYNGQN
jgi:asparagine synthase (glutamine-hydrolysing)